MNKIKQMEDDRKKIDEQSKKLIDKIQKLEDENLYLINKQVYNNTNDDTKKNKIIKDLEDTLKIEKCKKEVR
jgi:hypothetical protein